MRQVIAILTLAFLSACVTSGEVVDRPVGGDRNHVKGSN